MTRKQAARIRFIRARRSYSIKELGGLLGVHSRTVQLWHREGLSSIDDRSHPLLFLGAVAKDFLRVKIRKRRVKLGPNEFFCPRCRRAAQSIPGKINVISTGKRMGKNKELVYWRGECERCGCMLVRFATFKGQNPAPWPMVHTEGASRLNRTLSHAVNTDKERNGNASEDCQ